MAATKQGSIKLSSELDAEAFKAFKTTHFNDKSNSQVLAWLLDLGTKYLENENLVPNLGTKLVPKYLDSVPRFQNLVPKLVPNSVPESENLVPKLVPNFQNLVPNPENLTPPLVSKFDERITSLESSNENMHKLILNLTERVTSLES